MKTLLIPVLLLTLRLPALAASRGHETTAEEVIGALNDSAT